MYPFSEDGDRTAIMAFLRGSMAFLRHSSWRLHGAFTACIELSRRVNGAPTALTALCLHSKVVEITGSLAYYHIFLSQPLTLFLYLLSFLSTIPPLYSRSLSTSSCLYNSPLSLSLCYPPLYLLLLSTPPTLSLYAPGKERAWVGGMGRGAWVGRDMGSLGHG